MPKRSRHRPAKLALVGSSPTVTSILSSSIGAVFRYNLHQQNTKPSLSKPLVYEPLLPGLYHFFATVAPIKKLIDATNDPASKLIVRRR